MLVVVNTKYKRITKIQKIDEEKLIYPKISFTIVGCLFEVFKTLGPGHREKYYQKAVAEELKRRSVSFIEQYKIDLAYKGQKIGKCFFDFLIEGKIILELKTGKYFKRVNFEQLLEYLKTSNFKLGIIATFTEEGVKFYRILNS